ncbi:MAG TPA: urea carboxylase-associated family protein [Steroidobacter sp.]|uniref:urea carboxylase-associated family protein n=1 Tax=Steroidobacter sp. TaxID=1978227 RepID=UPI002ED9A823
MTLQRHIIPAGHGAALRLARGQHLRLIDPEGGQSGDLFAVSQDGRQRLSNGRTFDFGGTLYLSTGNQLWSDESEPLLTIVADDVGRHDFLYAPCNDDMYRIQYGLTDHPNCYINLTAALRTLNVPPSPLPTAFNFFMNVEIDTNGKLHIRAPRSRAGDSMVLRAEMDLAIALSACPAATCNGGGPTKPVAYEVF